MRKFLVKIWAYDHHASFNVEAEDNAESIEKAILDKIGKKSIKWENMENCYDSHKNRITYEEVINDRRPIHYETVLGTRVATGTPEVREA